eukprot:5495-Heterococcus_DN1.PRE.1
MTIQHVTRFLRISCHSFIIPLGWWCPGVTIKRGLHRQGCMCPALKALLVVLCFSQKTLDSLMELEQLVITAVVTVALTISN